MLGHLKGQIRATLDIGYHFPMLMLVKWEVEVSEIKITKLKLKCHLFG